MAEKAENRCIVIRQHNGIQRTSINGPGMAAAVLRRQRLVPVSRSSLCHARRRTFYAVCSSKSLFSSKFCGMMCVV